MKTLFKDKNRTIIILAMVLAAQAVLLIALNVFSSQNIKSRSLGKKLLSGFKKDNVVMLEISDYQDTFTVEKKGGAWIITDKGNAMPGNPVKVDAYLKTLGDLTQGVIRDKGTDENSDRNFGFDEKSYQKALVKMKNGKEHIIHIGNTGSKRGASYIRYNNEKKTREVASFISSETSNRPAQWAMTRVFENIAVEDVDKYELNASADWYKGSYAIRALTDEEINALPENDKKNAKFTVEPPVEGKSPKALSLESSIRNLLEVNIDDYKFNADLAKNPKKAGVKLTLKNGRSIALDIHKADKGDPADYILKTDMNEYTYLVSENAVKRFVRSKDELFK